MQHELTRKRATLIADFIFGGGTVEQATEVYSECLDAGVQILAEGGAL